MPKSARCLLLALALLIGRAAFAQVNNARMLSTPNTVTTTAYTFAATDTTRVVIFNSASAIAVTLPNGATAGFGAGTMLSVVNLGAGQVTVTCSSCTINGVATLALSQNQGADIYGGAGSPAVNYVALPSPAGSNIALQGGANTFTNANTFTQQIVSSVATGTAPFSVASTTVVPNLNASQLGGLNPPGSTIDGISDANALTNHTFDLSANTLKTATNTAGHYPRNNGTKYVDSAILAGDLPVFIASGASHAPGAVPARQESRHEPSPHIGIWS